MLSGLILALTMAAAQDAPAALPASTPALCRNASEDIENRVGYLLRQPAIISAGMDKAMVEQLARIEAFKMVGRPIADAMSARFHPRPRDEQGTLDARIEKMDFDQLFAFSKACLDMPPEN